MAALSVSLRVVLHSATRFRSKTERAGPLPLVTGEIAESVEQILFDEHVDHLFWQITTPGVHGVDLLCVTPEEAVLALEVNGTPRPGTCDA
jgi:hypothetical protein